MARQMDFSQAIPSPYSMEPEKQICQFFPNSSKEVKQFMAENLLTRTFYDPLDCEPSGFVTKGFIKWWDAYYKQYHRTLNDIIKGSTEKTKQLKEAEEAAEKERKRKEAEKEVAEESTKEARGEKKSRKRKPESSKTTSKRAKANPKKTIQTSDIPEESIPSGVNPKSASASVKTRPSESVQSSSEESLKEVSSKSKESTNSKKSKLLMISMIPLISEYEPLQLNNRAQNQNPPQNEDSSKGYSPSPAQEDLDDFDAQQTKKISNVEINNPSSSLTNKGILQKATLVKENCDALATAESDLKEKDAFYEKHLNNGTTMLKGLSTERAILVKKLAEIQAQIQEIDDKTLKIKRPLDKIVEKKVEIQDKLLEIKENQKLNEEDLKKIQKEEDEETQLFKSLCDDKIQLKETLQLFLKEIDN
ncbi:hypothetical protein PIB30_103181 [Stylosanthes scabra]|uniref:Uncharacterized protein n=1 Tax=Stylosanthes scabra TaxID=79078 RepID=A0ABU6V1N6_9FABA|nr:hypothetical protein [Stylosanthes scabra]